MSAASDRSPALAATLPARRGMLGTEPLAWLLAGGLGPLPNGTLVLTAPDGATHEVVLANGQLANIRLTNAPMYLGQIAYELSFVGLDALNATLLEVAKKKRLHGAVLLERKLLTRAQLAHCLTVQMQRKLHALFAAPPNTAFAFYPGIDALASFGGADGPRCDLRPSIWFGIREFAPRAHVSAILESVRGHLLQLARSTNAGCFGLDPDELAAAELLRDRPQPIEAFLAAKKPDPRRGELLLYCLLLHDCMHKLRPSTRTMQAVSVTTVTTPPPTSGFRPKVTPQPASLTTPTAAATAAKARTAALMAQAYAALRLGKIPLALQLCDDVHAIAPEEIEHLALHVWIGALRSDAQTEEATFRAIAELGRIITRHDYSADARYFRGQLYKRVGLMVEAALDFQAALALDPNRIDARAEVRLYMARRRSRG